MNLDRLNNEQKKAATQIEGPLLILAGAGSGKTATMTHRIAYMIEEGISPYNILAVTFTNKAAKEMRDRVEKLVGTVPGMWIMTFHAMSLRILREHADRIGYSKNFVVYDTVDQKAVIKKIAGDMSLDSKMFPLPYLSAVISKQKEKDMSPDDYFESEPENIKTRTLYKVYLAYEKELHKNDAMDFDDLLKNCLHLLKENEDILQKYRQRFKYIMVDEYQDTNHIQYEIIKMLGTFHKNVCVVGDDDQCIYQWRGADIRNILDFEKDFSDTKVIKLEQNYRSYGNILNAAHSVIRNNSERKDKELWTDKQDGDKIVYIRSDSDKEEARYIAREISLLNSMRSKKSGEENGFDDFAVLYRTNAQSRLFEDALKQARIPYQVLSGFSFYERKETKDIICYMRLVSNPKDDIALKRVINEPKRGLGNITLNKIEAMAQLNGESMFETLQREGTDYSLPDKTSKSIKDFTGLINQCRDEQENLLVSDIYDILLVKSGYMKALEDENTVEAEGRLENLLDFKSFIYDYEKEKKDADEQPDLTEFLERVATASDTDNYEESAGKVSLMTMHSAKGLEFPIVFMPGMEDGLFPSYRSFETEHGIEEERRLCYVGMTRAMEKLILTSAKYRVLYGKGDYTRESQFLFEIDRKLFDESADVVYTSSRRTDNLLKTNTGTFDGFAEKAFIPYDPLKYARNEVKASVSGGNDLIPGDRVKHKKFGEGMVIEADAKTVTVIFDSEGTKKLAKGLAPLTKL